MGELDKAFAYAKWANALFASAMRMVCSRTCIALPSFLAAA